MDCENSRNFGQLAALALNNSLNRATESYLDDILMLYHVHCHVLHDRGPIPCCCYYFVIRPKPAASWLSCLALTPDLKSPANQMYLD